eukprot:TRINITY_DN88374_c0_g1_i1.p1 TRINITY_DN88374_c0_g1~~TRINITY_DN88374_c0_g1_i1.p1  ORF type:complete len:371 (-),score=51.24 TRINITY_DN88374_c0_g1_i1:117-1082(-)
MCPDLLVLPDERGELPLQLAVSAADVPLVRLLATSDAAQRRWNARGETALAMAARLCEDLDIIKALLEVASPEALEKWSAEGNTVSMVAASHGKLSCLTEIAKYIPMTVTGSWRRTPLMAAVESSQPGSTRLLGSLGASATDLDSWGRPIPMLVDTKVDGHQNIRDARLKETLKMFGDVFGADKLMLQDPLGMNVLGRFVYSGEYIIVQYMLDELGVECNVLLLQNVTAANQDSTNFLSSVGSVNGVTPLDLVRRRAMWLVKNVSGKFISPGDDTHYQSLGAPVFDISVDSLKKNLFHTERILMDHYCIGIELQWEVLESE